MAPWIVVGVDSLVAWPVTNTDIEFRGHKLTLRPGSKELVPSIAFKHQDSLSLDEALLIVSHFLSSLAWVERTAVREQGVMGGSHPIQIGWPAKCNVITHNFRYDYLPDPADPRSRLALAIYREALGLNSVAYSFLGFFKSSIFSGRKDMNRKTGSTQLFQMSKNPAPFNVGRNFRKPNPTWVNTCMCQAVAQWHTLTAS